MNHTPWTVSEIPPQTGRLRSLVSAKGEPVLVEIPKPARDETAARTLWDVSRKLTGVAFAGFS
jgi:hypothetical protein